MAIFCSVLPNLHVSRKSRFKKNTASDSLIGPPKTCAQSTITPSIDLKVVIMVFMVLDSEEGLTVPIFYSPKHNYSSNVTNTKANPCTSRTGITYRPIPTAIQPQGKYLADCGCPDSPTLNWMRS